MPDDAPLNYPGNTLDLLQNGPAEAFRQIVSETADGVVAINDQHRIVLYNRAAESIFGHTASQVLGQPLEMLLPEASRKAHKQLIESFASEGGGARYMGERTSHIMGARADGTLVPLGATILRIQAQGGTLNVAILRDLSERMRLIEQLQVLASTDSLTGALNRRTFLERANHERARAERHGGDLALLIMDLDRFKSINDTFGHEAGDRVLQAFCQACRKSIRATDLFCRWGGEEFALLMPDTQLQGASVVAERIREDAQNSPAQFNDRTIYFTVSIGVGHYQSGDAIEGLVARADTALYASKHGGRNRVRLA